MAWPESEELEVLLQDCAARLVRDEGIALQGFGRVLAALVRPFVESARECGWPAPGSGIGVLGVEVEGEVVVRDAAGNPRAVRFRADRVDAVGDALVLCDYKTGRPPGKQKTAGPRRNAHVAHVTKGADLQSVAYALAGAALGGREAEGRLLHLRPDLETEVRVFFARSDDAEFGQAFAAAVAHILAAWDRGSFFPRLVEGARRDEPARCGYCEVKEACLRGDSGARSRLVGWIDDRRSAAERREQTGAEALAEEEREHTPESALFGVFELRGYGA